MRIHQGKIGCRFEAKPKQRAGVRGETREIASLVAIHSTGDLSAPIVAVTDDSPEAEVTQSLDELIGEQGTIHSMTPTEQKDESAEESLVHLSPEELVFPDSCCTPPATGRKKKKTVPTKKRMQPTSEERRSKIAWPAMNKIGWSAFDDDLDQVLQTALTGSVDRKLKALPSITYALGQERFGLKLIHLRIQRIYKYILCT
ncbi:hypothetical protein DPMN_163078 [Dreissena polymorpha]|uniref:Uncharacterized protein n=1 Tax=Dreissena polymorpha TaxID=45954 RepID=A0A9D4IUV8_DREPO|nr:hypothetical protein DPMN_163078 [Dreissena polymorpha]